MGRKALIVGCGDLGTEVGLRLAAEGWDVTGWRRRANVLPAAIRGQSVDLTDSSTPLPDIDDDVELVVICPTASERTGDGYRATFVEGTRRVLKTLGNRRPRIVFVSSTSVFGTDDGSWLDEDSPAEPTKPTAQALLQAEGLVRDYDDGVVLRPAGIYGPGRTRLIDKARTANDDVSPPHWTNRIHRDDVAAAVVHLGTRIDRPNDLYIGVDDEPALESDVLRWVGDEANGRGHDVVSSDEVAPANATGKRLRNSRLRSTGFEFTYPTFREGYRSVIDGVGVRHP